MPSTTGKPIIEIPVVNVSEVVVSTDMGEGAMIKLETEADADLWLVLSPTVLVQLEVMLARAAQRRVPAREERDGLARLRHREGVPWPSRCRKHLR